MITHDMNQPGFLNAEDVGVSVLNTTFKPHDLVDLTVDENPQKSTCPHSFTDLLLGSS